MSSNEAQLRQELGIPDSATQVIILGSTAHLDWDWVNTFYGYYSTTRTFDFTNYAVRDIFNNATQYLDANKNNVAQACLDPSKNQFPPYYYSIAEIGYLKKFASDQPAPFQTLQNVGALLRIVGGGITSPDNLLSHGETLLRNFLIANTWLLSSFPAQPSGGLPPLPALQQVWTPDDFGHDSQFPILMEAMGLQGVGFSRLPGDPQQYWTFGNDSAGLSGGSQMAAWQLALGDDSGNKGVDFIWQAADGSTTLAHFMQAGYFQGQSITSSDAVSQIENCFDTNKGASPTPYIFVPVGNDFSLPVPDLPQSACQWNAANFDSTEVYAVAATFDHYVQLVNCYSEQLLTRSSNPDPSNNILPFVPTPYWTGFYGTRPAIKIQHQQATRALLGAEVFSVVADFLSVPDSSEVSGVSAPTIDDGWEALTPSTHHDYITGTASNSVYTSDQLIYLDNARSIGNALLTKAQQRIASQVGTSPGTDQVLVTVFNQLGFARGGLVEMATIPEFTPFAFGDENGVIGPVQISSDGTWLFSIPSDDPSSIPALGYHTYYVTSDQSVNIPPFDSPATGNQTDSTTVSLSNSYLYATLTEDAGWGIATLDEIVEGNTSPVLQAPANQPIYFEDPGNMYKFATEPVQAGPRPGKQFDGETPDFAPSSVQVLENGPVRARLSVAGSYSVGGQTQQLTREYLLVVDEPFLRMKTTGAAPQPYSIFVSFPFSNPGGIDEMIHGTPYHWDTKPAQPVVNQVTGEGNYWFPPFFEATHQFVIPSSQGNMLGALYHAHLPAWAVTEDNSSLIGCLLRNPVNDKYSNSAGGDPDSHTLEYALRVEAGLDFPTTGTPLLESLSYSTPLLACEAGGNPAATLTSNFSFANLSDPSFFITALKPGTLPGHTDGEIIIRVYQPTNNGQSVTLTLPPPPEGQKWTARGITALETPLDQTKQATLNLSVADNQISFFAERALTTLALGLTSNQ